MIPGEMFCETGDIEINAGRNTLKLKVANTGDRPIQVGSHYHFFETNPALRFTRASAKGFRLNIAIALNRLRRHVDLRRCAFGCANVLTHKGRLHHHVVRNTERTPEKPAKHCDANPASSWMVARHFPRVYLIRIVDAEY